MSDYFGAVICVNGHVVSSVLSPGERHDPRCGKCGNETMTECKQCHAPLRGSAHGVLADYKVKNNCWSCGGVFPWRQEQLDEVEDILALRADTEDWDAATRERLEEATGRIAAGTASPDYVMALADWLDRSSGPAAKKTLWEIVKTLGTELLIAGVKAHFNIP